MECFNCGSELIWQSDWMESELEGYEPNEVDEDDDRVVNYLWCPNCHSDVYVKHPSNNMIKEYEEEQQEQSK